jgi:signal transduction histidine kinase
MITALHLFAEPPSLDYQTVELEAVLEEAIAEVRKRMPEAPAVNFSPSPALPSLHVDRGHLATVLAELMLNAHQATADAESQAVVRVRAQIDPLDEQMLIQVTDEGAGMEASTLEHAFDPFFSARAAGRRPGLGLPRAVRLIEAMEGRIDLQSTLGEGTTATVRLPVATSDTSRSEHPDQSLVGALADDLPESDG